jgi:GGDEF domain-containing protein
MQQADIAMYQAKQAGGRAYRFADRIASPVANASVHSQPSTHPQENKPTH